MKLSTVLNLALLVNQCRDRLEPFLPALCLSCQERCFHPSWLCQNCYQQIRANRACRPRSHGRSSPLSTIVAPLAFDGPLRKLIHAWKFRGQSELTPLLVRLALDQAVPPPANYWLPIPMHWRKQLQRGVNQTVLLAAELTRQLPQTNCAPISTLLKVTGTSVNQHQLNRTERARLSQNSFSLRREVRPLEGLLPWAYRRRNPRPFLGQSVTLIDDVITTGSTLAAAANVLKIAGAKSVNAWCLAHTP